MKKASIIISTKDKPARLGVTLKALNNQIHDDIEVIVVFDGCREEVIADFDQFEFTYKPIKIVLEKNIGRSGARNAGILKATGEIVILIDDDRLSNSDFVDKHIKSHEGNGRYAVIGDRRELDYSDEMIDQLSSQSFTEAVFQRFFQDSIQEKNSMLKRLGRKIFGQMLECITFSTGNVSVAREDLLGIGMLDENFLGWGVEDMDLGYRLIKNGVKVVRDYSIKNYHLLHQVNWEKQKKEYYRNLAYFLDKINDDRVGTFLAKFLSSIVYK